MKDFHYHFGIHSNIPECCAKFFQEKISQGVEDVAATCRPEYLDIEKYFHVQYVLCDTCHAKMQKGELTPNVIHYCHREPNDDCKIFSEIIYDFG
jgi:hypothetical protein